MEVVASLSQGRTAASQCGLFTHKSVPVIFEPPCNLRVNLYCRTWVFNIYIAKGPRPLLWAGSRAASGKITISGIPNRLN